MAAGVATAPPEPAPKPMKLATQSDVAEAMRGVIRQVAAGDLSPIEGMRLTRTLKALAETMAGASLQERLDRIEATLKAGGRMK